MSRMSSAAPRSRPRSAPLALVLAGSIGVAGCTPESATDPDLDLPCGEREGREVVVGTGESHFEAIGDSGVSIVAGPQGGHHILIGLRCRSLGPKVTAEYGVRDADTGEELTLPNLHSVLLLEYDGEADEASGIYGYLDGRFVMDLPGRHVALWATVTDDCDAPTSGEKVTWVKGFD